MSSRNQRVLSLEDKVRIISKYRRLGNAHDRRQFRTVNIENEIVLANQIKILNQYGAMHVKLAAVRDLVITEYGKPNYLAEKHAFLEKVMTEWYKRAIAALGVKGISVALVCHKTNLAKRILNITGLPLSETRMGVLKRNCQDAYVNGISNGFESLNIREIVQELLVKLNISKETALSVYGPNIFEEKSDDDEDPRLFPSPWKKRTESKKLMQSKMLEQLDYKNRRTSNEEDESILVRDMDEGIEFKQSGGIHIETESEDDTDGATYTNAWLWPSEPEVEKDNQYEDEDFELYDVVSVVGSTDDFDAATSTKNNLADPLIKKECETWIDNEKEAVIPQSDLNPCTVVKVEPDESQSTKGYTTDSIAITNVREMVEDWLIKNECDTTQDVSTQQQASATLEPSCSIKIESDGSEDGMSTTTYVEDCARHIIEEDNSDREPNFESDEEGLVQIFAVVSEESSSDVDAAVATPSMNNGCVDTDQDAIRSLELIRGYLQLQQNSRALEALSKVKAAFSQSATNPS